MFTNVHHVVNFILRHGTLLILAFVIVLLGGLSAEQIGVFKSAALAECVALFLSHIALYVFTDDNYQDSEARNARTIVFLAVHLLVGIVYAGSYFVEFSPAG